MFLPLLAAVICSGFLAPGDATQDAESWGRFRGPNGSGVSASAGLPSKVGPTENLAWRVECGAGASSPIVTDGRLYLTTHADAGRSLEAFDAATGARAWSLTMDRQAEMRFTAPNGPATVTPVTDGERVFAFFPDAGLIAATVEGRELWRVPLAPTGGMHGIASSLVLADDRLILLADQLEGSFIAAYDCSSGERLWKQDRFNGMTGGHSTPIVYEPPGGSAQLLVFGPVELVAYRPDNGERLWWATGMGNAPVGVPVLFGNKVIVSEPVFEPMPFKVIAGMDADRDGRISPKEHEQDASMSRFVQKIDRDSGNGDGTLEESEWDKSQEAIRGKGGLAAIELGGQEDVAGSNVRWTYKKQVPYIPSVLVYDQVLYMAQDGGLMTTFEPETGEVIKRGRLQQAGGQYWASPVAGDGKVYLVNTEGGLTVLKAGREWEELSFGELGEQALATPAIANGRLYVRTEKTLWCFKESGADVSRGL